MYVFVCFSAGVYRVTKAKVLLARVSPTVASFASTVSNRTSRVAVAVAVSGTFIVVVFVVVVGETTQKGID